MPTLKRKLVDPMEVMFLITKGLTHVEIGKTLGFSRQSISRAIRRWGIKKNMGRPKMDDRTFLRIFLLAKSSGWGDAKIAKAVGFHHVQQLTQRLTNLRKQGFDVSE